MNHSSTLPVINVDSEKSLVSIGTHPPQPMGSYAVRLIRLLAKHPNSIVPRERILIHLYDTRGKQRPKTNTLKVFICHLRDALAAAGYPRTLIKNDHGNGYGLTTEQTNSRHL